MFERFSEVALTMAIGLLASTEVSAQETVPRPAKVFTVEATTSEITRNYPAIVLPSAEVELSFRVSGRVIDLPVRGAMAVEKRRACRGP